jgi:hypothetical protein
VFIRRRVLLIEILVLCLVEQSSKISLFLGKETLMHFFFVIWPVILQFNRPILKKITALFSVVVSSGSFRNLIIFKMNNAAPDISLSGVDSIHGVTSERVLSSWTFLALSVRCMFVPTDCWFRRI